jgi:hypothetical protein
MLKELKFIHITKTAGSSIERIGKKNNILWGKFHKEYGWWHEIFPRKKSSLKDKYDWFTVVRNPYTRVVSEFYYCYPVRSKTKNVNEFNQLIQQSIKRRSKNGDHWTEQYKYFDSDYDIQVLKFENINQDFKDLMNKYSINIELSIHENQTKNKIFDVKDLSSETLDLVRKIYSKDFSLFNYDI